jgi:hypothetical protein
MLMDRVRAADPARPEEFEGLQYFDGLVLGKRPRRRRRALIAVPAVALAAVLTIALLPAPAPQAKEVLRRAVNAMAIDDGGILYAEMSVHSDTDDYGTRRVWVRGDDVRFLQVSGFGDVPAGMEEITHDGTITRYAPDGTQLLQMKGMMVPGEIFRSAALLKAAREGKAVTLEQTDDAYVLHWTETPGIDMALWVDRETYKPLRFTDRSAKSTLTETVNDFQRLPDTPENRRLLTLHQGTP